MWTPEQAVLDANSAFYEAFSARDYNAMVRVWSQKHEISCMHPGWSILRGSGPVLASWRAIFDGDAGALRCDEARVVLLDHTGLVTCLEILPRITLAATNVYVLEDGAWRLIHHHAGPAERKNSGRPPAPMGSLN